MKVANRYPAACSGAVVVPRVRWLASGDHSYRKGNQSPNGMYSPKARSDLVEVIADLPFRRYGDGAVPALLAPPAARRRGDEPDRDAVRDLPAVVSVPDGAEVVADLRPDHEIRAAGGQFRRLRGEREHRGVRIAVKLCLAHVRLRDSDADLRRGLLAALDCPDAERSIGERRPEDRDRDHQRSEGAPEGGSADERVGDRSVDEPLQGGEEQDAAQVRDLDELDRGHERDSRVALEEQGVAELGGDEAEGQERGERPSGRRPGPAQRPGEDREEPSLHGADDEVAERREPEWKIGEGAEEVDDPDVPAEMGDESEEESAPEGLFAVRIAQREDLWNQADEGKGPDP
jgi:hypothetical protein